MGFLCSKVLHPHVISLFSIAKDLANVPQHEREKEPSGISSSGLFSVLQLTFNDLLLQVRCGPYTQCTIKWTEVNSLHKTIYRKLSTHLSSLLLRSSFHWPLKCRLCKLPLPVWLGQQAPAPANGGEFCLLDILVVKPTLGDAGMAGTTC